MCVPTQIICCCLNEDYLAEKPLGKNSWNSVIMAEHTWTGPWAWAGWVATFPHARISAKWALKVPSKTPFGNVLSLKTALCHLLPSLHANGFIHFPLTLSGMMHALLSLNFSLCGKCNLFQFCRKDLFKENLVFAHLIAAFPLASSPSHCILLSKANVQPVYLSALKA